MGRNAEGGRSWPNLSYYSGMSGNTEENHKNIIQDNRPTSRDPKIVPEWKPQALPLPLYLEYYRIQTWVNFCWRTWQGRECTINRIWWQCRYSKDLETLDSSRADECLQDRQWIWQEEKFACGAHSGFSTSPFVFVWYVSYHWICADVTKIFWNKHIS